MPPTTAACRSNFITAEIIIIIEMKTPLVYDVALLKSGSIRKARFSSGKLFAAVKLPTLLNNKIKVPVNYEHHFLIAFLLREASSSNLQRHNNEKLNQKFIFVITFFVY